MTSCCVRQPKKPPPPSRGPTPQSVRSRRGRRRHYRRPGQLRGTRCAGSGRDSVARDMPLASCGTSSTVTLGSTEPSRWARARSCCAAFRIMVWGENSGSDLYPVRAGPSPRAVAACATTSGSQATSLHPRSAPSAGLRAQCLHAIRGALLPAVPRGWGSADAGWPIRPRRGGRSPPATPQHRPRRSQHPPRPVSPGRPALSCLGGVFGWCRSRRRLGLRPRGTSRRRWPSACRCRSCRPAGPGGPGPPSR